MAVANVAYYMASKANVVYGLRPLICRVGIFCLFYHLVLHLIAIFILCVGGRFPYSFIGYVDFVLGISVHAAAKGLNPSFLNLLLGGLFNLEAVLVWICSVSIGIISFIGHVS